MKMMCFVQDPEGRHSFHRWNTGVKDQRRGVIQGKAPKERKCPGTCLPQGLALGET